MIDARAFTENLGGRWQGNRGQAPCPICQPERRRDQKALSISETDGKLLLHCFKSHCAFADIARAAGADLAHVQTDPAAQHKHDARRAAYDAEQRAKARALWNRAQPIRGTKAERYLRGRGIKIDLPESLRFTPDIHHGPSMSWACAMVANVQPTGGVHRTFFDKQGNRLPKSAKMMLGPCSGGAVALSEGTGPLVVSEGIETGLSVLQILPDRRPRVWATLSTSGMKAVILPAQPQEIIVATDGDAPGRLAGHALASRAAALGWAVNLMPAPEGQDWNDVLRQGGLA